MERVDFNRPEFKIVSIDEVIPNPLNPRRDVHVNSEELQRILLNRGWEEGLTVYKRGAYYLLLSGHRRWHAAKRAGMKEVPVYVVEAPKNAQEEIERIGSLQLAHKEWTTYEWAKFTYESWIYWKKPTYSEFAEIINLSKDKVSEYVTVFEYYPRDEIEDKLEQKIYTIRVLAILTRWMKRFKTHQHELIETMTESMVRRMMLKKAEKKRLDPNALKGDRFVEVATPEQMREFLVHADMSLRQAQSLLGVENFGDTGYWQSTVHKISHIVRDIPTMQPRDRDQAQNMTKYLNMLIQEAEKKRTELIQFSEDHQIEVDFTDQQENVTNESQESHDDFEDTHEETENEKHSVEQL